jgi:hypothetical protein
MNIEEVSSEKNQELKTDEELFVALCEGSSLDKDNLTILKLLNFLGFCTVSSQESEFAMLLEYVSNNLLTSCKINLASEVFEYPRI